MTGQVSLKKKKCKYDEMATFPVAITGRFLRTWNEGFCPRGSITGKTREMEFSGCINSKGRTLAPATHQKSETPS